ncbi:MAG: twin-arginine translocase TatA/TatE family subunit [Synergistaceae bacterium]|nr:twin-arginine translocase TatA/TatE family subunit [Synergistaceae bacterium]
MHLGITEILLLIFLALVLFGGNKLSGVGKALGRSIKDFKTELQGTDSKSSSEEIEAETKS